MAWIKSSFFVSFSETLALGLLLSPAVFSQSPLAEVDLGGKKLEIWSAETISAVQVGTRDAYPLLTTSLDSLQQWKDSGEMPSEIQSKMGMQFQRWQATKERGLGKYTVLGALLRDADGKISSENLEFSTSIRSTDGQANTISHWCNDRFDESDCLLSKRTDVRNWADPVLSPLPIRISEGAGRLEKMEGFAIFTPVTRHRFSFTIEELQRKERKTDGDITVLPVEYNESGNQKQLILQLFRPLPALPSKNAMLRPSKRAANGFQGIQSETHEFIKAREAGDSAALTIQAKKGDGTLVAPRAVASISNSGQFNHESAITIEKKLRLKSDSSGAEKPDRTQKKSKAVGNIRVELSRYDFEGADIREFEIVVVRSSGIETIAAFTLPPIDLQGNDRRESLRPFLTSLERSTESKASPSNQTRTWKSSSGKFTVEAELVLFDGTKVHLRKKDGESIEVPVERLCPDDQKYLDQL